MFRKPAARKRASASATPGRISRSSNLVGAYGRPSRTMLRVITPSRSRKTARRSFTTCPLLLPLGCDLLKRGMRDEAVPDHGLEGLGVRRDAVRIHRRHDDHAVADL